MLDPQAPADSGKRIIVEGTAGNTGIGLALMANARGYRCVIVMPSNQSSEKIDMLRALGAQVELTDAAPFADPRNYYHVARKRAADLGAFWANQFENTANADAHEQSTGPEIWRQTQGHLDGVVMAAGTGGTIGGITKYLKEQNTSIATYVVDPEGSSLYNYVKHGTLEAAGSSITEGIGIRRITANFARARIDDAFTGLDTEVGEMAHFVLKHEGIFIGGSAALNCCGAVKLARQLGAGKTIVTILCDGGSRYQSRLFNADWLREKNLSPKGADTLDFVA